MTKIVFWSFLIFGGEHLNRKQEILNAATKSFSLFGYKATTVDQVAKIANVGKGTIYTFFENKEQLLHFAVKNLIEEMRQEADRAINSNNNFMTNAHSGLMKMLEFRERHQLFAKLLEEERQLATPEVKHMLAQIEDEFVSYLANFIETGIEKGEIQACDSKLVAYLLLKAYKALIVDWENTYGEPLDEQSILNLFKQTIFNGLLKPTEK